MYISLSSTIFEMTYQRQHDVKYHQTSLGMSKQPHRFKPVDQMLDEEPINAPRVTDTEGCCFEMICPEPTGIF